MTQLSFCPLGVIFTHRGDINLRWRHLIWRAFSDWYKNKCGNRAPEFGGVVYIRWELAKGGYWSRIILSRGKIGPKSRLTIPRMELNGAVINKRLAEFAESVIKRKIG